jgi:hypothetical protein
MKKTFYASGGLDMHKREDIKNLYLEVASARLDHEGILGSLKRGEFITTNGVIVLPSLANPSGITIGFIYVSAFVQFIPNISKKILRKMSGIFKRYAG